MNLCKFLHFNDKCPVCGKALTTYMYVQNSTLWKAVQTDPGVYQFTQCIKKKPEYTSSDSVTLYDLGSVVETRFNSSKLVQDSKAWTLFFFNSCASDGVADKVFDEDINWYDVCYYRSSPWYEFKNHPDDVKKWQLQLVVPEHANLDNRDENFAFKKMNGEGLEKVYLLSMDHENKITKFYHYSTTVEERKLEDFEPKIFEKDDLPALKVRPDFSLEHRDRLFERFDTWILLS